MRIAISELRLPDAMARQLESSPSETGISVGWSSVRGGIGEHRLLKVAILPLRWLGSGLLALSASTSQPHALAMFRKSIHGDYIIRLPGSILIVGNGSTYMYVQVLHM
jgi:hypothetical protein